MSKLRARRPVDQEAADSFVSGAERPPEPPTQPRPEPIQSVPRSEPKPRSESQAVAEAGRSLAPPQLMPWDGLPENANRPFQLRLPAPVYAKLQWAAEKAGKSMHKIALEAVRQAVEREVRKHIGDQQAR